MSLQRRFTLAFVLALLLIFAGQSQAAQYGLVITVDNAYVFGFGNATAVANLGTVVINTTAAEIFSSTGPEPPYTVNSGSNSYVYIAAWADDATANGVLASFTSNGVPIFSAGMWEVYATLDKTSTAAQALTMSSINSQITNANNTNGWRHIGPAPSLAEDPYPWGLYASAAGQSSFSQGFTNNFSNLNIGWMWYNNGASSNPFEWTAAGDAGWLIFRAGIPLLCDAGSTGLFNTGVNGTANVLADGAIDTHYTLLSGPAPVNPGDPTFKSQTNPGNWLPNDQTGTAGGSAWIGRSAVAASESVGSYTYRLLVNIPNNSNLPTVTGRWSADNAGTDILVNNLSTTSVTGGFNSWQGFSIPGTMWNPGTTNTVDFVVRNDSTYQGLRVEWCKNVMGQAAIVPTVGPWGYVALFALTMAVGIYFLTRS